MSITLEVQIDTLDEEDIRAAETALKAPSQDISVRRWPRARVVDPLTIFAVVGGAVGLVDALLSLRERWVTRRRSVKIRIKNEANEELELIAANRADLENFLARSGSSPLNVIPPD